MLHLCSTKGAWSSAAHLIFLTLRFDGLIELSSNTKTFASAERAIRWRGCSARKRLRTSIVCLMPPVFVGLALYARYFCILRLGRGLSVGGAVRKQNFVKLRSCTSSNLALVYTSLFALPKILAIESHRALLQNTSTL